MKHLVLTISALAIGALIAEIALRAIGYSPHRIEPDRMFAAGRPTTWSIPDPELGWINKPGVAISVETGGAEMTFWNFGRRATRPDPLPAPGSIPVMVVGGSTLQGYGVKDEDTFAYKLGREHPQLSFENFGTGGYSTVQALLLAKRAYEKFYGTEKPKAVVLVFDDSHASRNVADQSWVLAMYDSRGEHFAPPHYRVRGDKLEFRPFRSLPPWPFEGASAALSLLHDSWVRLKYDSADEAEIVTAHVIDEFEEFARANHMALGVAVLQDTSGIGTRLFANRAFPHVDCSDLEKSDPHKYQLGGSGHPTAEVHAHYTKCVGELIEKLRPSPAP
jgi:hypothetical protein